LKKNTEDVLIVTGVLGFVGYHLSTNLLNQGYQIIGIDNINDYYDVFLKFKRLSNLEKYENFTFIRLDISEQAKLYRIFDFHKPDIVINLAAQAGVRYSIENPRAYIDSNIQGFHNILEACRKYPVKHLLYASSSSVYGNQQKTPFSTTDNVDNPISLYAATKKSNELMAHTYSHLYNIPTTGLRFFTVYGPYGRPDMAYYSFTEKIIKGEPIKIFNNGDLYRDFTYIDDIVTGIVNMIDSPPKKEEATPPYKIYNIGNNKPVKLMDFIVALENAIGIKAKKEYLPMQPGDVYQTYADVDDLMKDFDFKPSTSIEEGLQKFVDWYMEYYGIQVCEKTQEVLSVIT
jgi:UDP-glucuronate 4-epimerase